MKMKMTEEQEEHLKRIKTNFTSKVDAKYRKGQEEHGGNLIYSSALRLINMAIEEAIDQIVYLETLAEVIVGREE
jgi:hypothetical protein